MPDERHELRFGRVTVRPASRQLLVDGQPASAGARAFDVLLALIERRDRVVSKEELLNVVWQGLVVEENNIQVQISTLRKLLGAHAITTVPGRGYRFTLEPDSDAAAPEPADEPAAQRLMHTPASRGERPLSRTIVIALAALVLLVGAGTLWLGRLQHPSPQAAPPLRSVLMLPFAAGDDDPGLSVLAMRMGADVARTLGDNLRHMRVSPLAAVSTVGRNVDARTLGREANVRFIVEGTVHRSAPDNLEFTLRLTDTLDGRQLDAARVGATPGQAESDTSRRLVAAARQMLTGAVARVVRAAGEQAASAQDLLDLALAVPIQDAVANAREVRRLASAAIQRDPNLAGAWAARAEAGTMLYFTDFTADGKALQAEIDADSYRAVTLDPGDVDAWIARANALRVQGNLDGGFAALDRAEQAQPSRYFPRFVRAWLLLDAGKPQEALSIVSDLRRALGPDAGSSLQACNAHLMLGSYEAAIAECERVISWDIWQVHASLAAAHAMLGHDEKANEARRRLVQAAPGFTLARYVSRFHPALAAGARDQEVAHLLPGLRKAGVPE